MNMKQIELVLDLSRTLSYRQTAENLFISQPALTHQIKALEEEIGVTLFARSNRGVSLTPAGTLFCREMAHVHQETWAAISSTRNCAVGEYEDVLRIGLNATRSRSAVAELLRRYALEQPATMIELRQEPRGMRLDTFLRGGLDMVFYLSEAFPDSAAIRHSTLFHSRLYCVVHRDDPLAGHMRISPADLAGHDVMLASGNAPDALRNAQKQLMETTPIRGRFCQDIETALLWIEATGGAAIVPGFCHDGNPRYAWIPYDFPETIPCGIAWRAEDQRADLAAFVQLAETVFHEKNAQAGAIL